jgi:hypothetical protein
MFLSLDYNDIYNISIEFLLRRIYNGEFDPGSGWTLAAGLIHASQGGSNTTGARVRNAYVTYLYFERDANTAYNNFRAS